MTAAVALPRLPRAPRIIAAAMSASEPPHAGSRANERAAAAEPLTQLLRRASAGESAAAELALPLVYRELQRIARARMAGERADHTLQATALVHETWLKLVGMGGPEWTDRAAFYQAAATAMRRILVDHARARRRTKRGGGAARDPVTLGALPARQPDLGDAATFLQLDEEIARLEASDPRAGAVVRLRFFAGLDVDETAAALGMSRRTVLREWAFARARLYTALADRPADGE
jgi:RNA polymerase sigma-70 factor (ECF subfamily)